MASSSIRPSSRYSSSIESDTSPSPSSNLLSSSRRYPHAAAAMEKNSSSSSRAMVVRARSGDMITGALITTTTNNNNNKSGSANTFGTMVKKFMEKRSGSADRKPLAAAAAATAKDINKKNKKDSNFTALHRKLFQKASDRPALAELKPAGNARTLGMVLRSERELLTQNKDYEDEIQQLRLMLDEKNREVEKLKDLCLKQREEIKALKDAILFPDVLNSQLQKLLEQQGSELKQARQIIPSLQMQVSSLTGQLHCLAEDLAEVKADKYGVTSCFDGHISSPQTPKSDQDAQNSLEYSSGCPMTYGSPDEMFLKDLNPCLTPCFSKTKSKEFDQIMGYDSPSKDGSPEHSREFIPDDFSSSQGGILSKSLEKCRRLSHGSKNVRKIYKSDESRWSIGKPKHQNLS